MEDIEALIQTTISHYDKTAERFWHGTKDHDVTQNYQALLSHLPKNISLDILDLGCGPGRDVEYFHSLGHKVVGLDASIEFCKMAREKTGCEILHQEFGKLSLKPYFP